jgi:hypothetical protein
MSSKQSDPLLFGKVQTEAMFNLQKELLDGYMRKPVVLGSAARNQKWNSGPSYPRNSRRPVLSPNSCKSTRSVLQHRWK